MSVEGGRGRFTSLYTYAVAVALAWNVIVIGSFLWYVSNARRQTRQNTLSESRAHFDKDQAFRLWGASHGGVYVPTDGRTPPNPYLSHVPERDIETPSGHRLTLMNPAYMVRQMMEEHSTLYGVKGRLSSLKPLRPDSSPDQWERRALELFEQGEDEVAEFAEIDGVPHLRLMRPMVVETRCLKCHAHQGYEVGDIRGGVGVSVPLAPYLAAENQTREAMSRTHGLIWILGLAGIGAVAWRGRRNIIAREEAEESMMQSSRLVSLGQMAAGVAHELNQPLTTISLLAERVELRQERGMEVTDQMQAQWARAIVEQVDRMSGIINHLRAFSRDRSHDLHSEVAVNDVVEGALKMTGAQLKSQGIEVHLDLGADLPPVLGEPFRLEQVLLNLIRNSQDAMEERLDPDGEPEGDIREKALAIRTRRRGDGNEEVTLEVEDSGVGMSEETRLLLFQPFFTTKDPDKGTGLGLSISHTIVRDHGGRIECESEEGMGTRFRVILPASSRIGEGAIQEMNIED